MFLKRKSSFLYLPNGKKYFDFSINFSSEVFNYDNSFINRKAKNYLKKRNFSLINKQPSKQGDAWKVDKLVNIFPLLKDYEFLLIGKDQLTHFFLSNRFNLMIDPLEALNERDFIRIKENSLLPSAKGIHEFNLISDLFLNFAASSDFLKDEKSPKNILYLNSTFPNLSILKKENIFSIIIVGGHHPWGLDHLKLIMLKKNQHEELRQHFERFSTDFLTNYHLYLAGIGYYKKKIKENNFKKNQAIINQRIFELKEHEKVKAVQPSRSENIFLYKIILEEDNRLKSLGQEDSFPRIFSRSLSCYFLKNTIYVHLPINIPTNHLFNKFKKLAKVI